ncbi:uncharacterized protein N7482_008310 [Penicillium canariense]|uniref:Uncharacterized protein n=1 Tax=Penicillium canariense TaxID=189055 RepID=A0A9W9LIW0_9EURO|nr:uncharacterized protein N7482_008310 [Penicillium canariense]KAJ5157210.1 hypothetical protein N7482_008310 [Penicillium canariense]
MSRMRWIPQDDEPLRPEDGRQTWRGTSSEWIRLILPEWKIGNERKASKTEDREAKASNHAASDRTFLRSLVHDRGSPSHDDRGTSTPTSPSHPIQATTNGRSHRFVGHFDTTGHDQPLIRGSGGEPTQREAHRDAATGPGTPGHVHVCVLGSDHVVPPVRSTRHAIPPRPQRTDHVVADRAFWEIWEIWEIWIVSALHAVIRRANCLFLKTQPGGEAAKLPRDEAREDTHLPQRIPGHHGLIGPFVHGTCFPFRTCLPSSLLAGRRALSGPTSQRTPFSDRPRHY